MLAATTWLGWLSGAAAWLVWGVFAAIAMVLGFGQVRRALISRPLLGWIRSVLPQMSDALCQRTETPWIDSMPNTGWPSDGVQE